MKRIISSVLLIMIIISMMLTTACSAGDVQDIINNNTKTQLLVPTNLRVDEGSATLMWNGVEHASGYTVLANETTYTTTTNSFALQNLRDGEYTIAVMANGDGLMYVSSAYSDTISYTRKSDSGNKYEDVVGAFGSFDEINTKNSFLGYGIDIINASAVTSKNVLMNYPIFDMDKLQKETLLKSNEYNNSFVAIEAKTIEEFLENRGQSTSISTGSSVSAKGNIYGVNVGASVSCSAGVSNGFTKTNQSTESQHFLEIVSENQSYWLILQTTEARYKELLSDEFKKDLYNPNLSPELLFQKYGTHLLTSVAMGGSISMCYTMYSYSEEELFSKYTELSSQIKADVNASYGSYSGSAGSEMSYENAYQYHSSAAASNIQVDVVITCSGGGSYGIVNEKTLYNNYYEWQKSLSTYPVLIGVKDNNSLYAIWDLLDLNVEGAAERYEELYSYFCEYGTDSYNELCATYALTPKVSPENISNIKIGETEKYIEGDIIQVKSGDTMRITFDVLPENANRYTKTFVSSNPEAIQVDSNGIIFVNSEAPSDTQVTITIGAGSISKKITFYIVNTYDVHFNTGFDDITVPPIIGKQSGHTISAPEVYKEGYYLVGWYRDSGFKTEFDFDVDRVTSNMTLYAKWQKIKPVIIFDTGLGTAIESQIIEYNGTVKKPKNPSLTGYNFDGWFADEECTEVFDFASKVKSDITIYAKWSKIVYTVKFEANGGTPVADAITSIEFGYKISEPETTKTYYTLVGWYKDSDFSQKFYFDTEVVSDITLYAKWSLTNVSVRFLDNDGISPVYDSDGNIINDVITNLDKEFKISVPDGYKKGRIFDGWYLNGKKIDLETFDGFRPNENGYVLHARWVGDGSTYNVIFLDKDGNEIYKDLYKNLSYGTVIDAPTLPDENVEGYSYTGWDKIFPYTISTEDVTVRAIFEVNVHTIKFVDFDGNTTLLEAKIAYGTSVTAPVVPDLSGYVFIGWDKAVPQTMPDYDVIIQAERKIITHTIIFDINKGNKTGDFSQSESSQSVVYGSTTTIINTMQSSGYNFSGWSLDADGTQMITDSVGKILKNVSVYTDGNGYWIYGDNAYTEIVLYAQWSARTFTVTYNLNGGNCSITSDNVVYDSFYSLPTPTKNEHYFCGWYLNGADGKAVSNSTQITTADNHTLEAVWVRISCSITYTSSANVDEDEERYEMVYTSLDVAKLKSLGYTKINVSASVHIKESDDGFQRVWIYTKNGGEQCSFHEFNGGSGSSDDWTAYYSFTIDLNKIGVDSNGYACFYVRWGARGDFGDDWTRGKRTWTVTATY